jgi:hypothetical protein
LAERLNFKPQMSFPTRSVTPGPPEPGVTPCTSGPAALYGVSLNARRLSWTWYRPTDRAMPEDTLAAAELHLADAERQVANQRELVAQLERDCDDR